MDRLFSVEQARGQLGGVSRWTVYAWLSQGRLRRTKVGARTMIRESDLQAFIAACNPEPTTPTDADAPSGNGAAQAKTRAKASKTSARPEAQ